MVKFLYCLKKREISRLVGKLWRLDVIHCHSLPLVVSLCNALSLVVTLVVICCHSLSFVVTGCVTHCHWLSLDVPLASLFIKDHKKRKIYNWLGFKKWFPIGQTYKWALHLLSMLVEVGYTVRVAFSWNSKTRKSVMLFACINWESSGLYFT